MLKTDLALIKFIPIKERLQNLLYNPLVARVIQ